MYIQITTWRGINYSDYIDVNLNTINITYPNY